MSKPETNFYTSVHKHLPPIDELYRMKNANDYIGGVPDFWFSAARDLWVEYKFIVVPKRNETMIDMCAGKNPKLSVLQQNWLSSRLDEGRDVAVIVGCKDGGFIMDSPSGPDGWLTPIAAREFRAFLLTRKQIADWIVQRIT